MERVARDRLAVAACVSLGLHAGAAAWLMLGVPPGAPGPSNQTVFEVAFGTPFSAVEAPQPPTQEDGQTADVPATAQEPSPLLDPVQAATPLIPAEASADALPYGMDAPAPPMLDLADTRVEASSDTAPPPSQPAPQLLTEAREEPLPTRRSSAPPQAPQRQARVTAARGGRPQAGPSGSEPGASSAGPHDAGASPVIPVAFSTPPVITAARYRHPPTPPAYPPRAVSLGMEGTALVRALVGPDGITRTLRLHRSSGHRDLDQAALDAVRGWAFAAATEGGRPIEAWVEVPVRFRLD